MTEIVKIDGSDLKSLKHLCDAITNPRTSVVRVAIDDGSLKVKINSSLWTIPLGSPERGVK